MIHNVQFEFTLNRSLGAEDIIITRQIKHQFALTKAMVMVWNVGGYSLLILRMSSR
jgi:hypothetical protein